MGLSSKETCRGFCCQVRSLVLSMVCSGLQWFSKKEPLLVLSGEMPETEPGTFTLCDIRQIALPRNYDPHFTLIIGTSTERIQTGSNTLLKVFIKSLKEPPPPHTQNSSTPVQQWCWLGSHGSRVIDPNHAWKRWNCLPCATITEPSYALSTQKGAPLNSMEVTPRRVCLGLQPPLVSFWRCHKTLSCSGWNCGFYLREKAHSLLKERRWWGCRSSHSFIQ